MADLEKLDEVVSEALRSGKEDLRCYCYRHPFDGGKKINLPSLGLVDGEAASEQIVTHIRRNATEGGQADFEIKIKRGAEAIWNGRIPLEVPGRTVLPNPAADGTTAPARPSKETERTRALIDELLEEADAANRERARRVVRQALGMDEAIPAQEEDDEEEEEEEEQGLAEYLLSEVDPKDVKETINGLGARVMHWLDRKLDGKDEQPRATTGTQKGFRPRGTVRESPYVGVEGAENDEPEGPDDAGNARRTATS